MRHIPHYVWVICVVVFVVLITVSQFLLNGGQKPQWLQINDVAENNEDKFLSTRKQCEPRGARKVMVSRKLYPGVSCIDGSEPAYYYREGHGNGSDKWLVYFEGGGWCYNITQYAYRAYTDLGSSAKYPDCVPESRMNFYISSQ
jgi:hypothetical protein